MSIVFILTDTLQRTWISPYRRIINLHGGSIQMTSEQGKEALEIYPNPASSKVHVRIASPETGPLAIDIFNLSGEKVLNKIILLPDTQVELDISKLGKGIYMIKVTGSQKNFVRKLIVQ